MNKKTQKSHFLQYETFKEAYYMFSTDSTKAFWSWLHYSFSRPSLCLHLYFITQLQDLNVSELSLTSLPMQCSCFFFCDATSTFRVPSSSLPPFFWLPPLFPSLGTSHTPFLTLSSTSHTLRFFLSLPLSPFSLTKMSLLSLHLVSAALFPSLTLRGGCSPPLYANNVPVLREEAA